MKFSMRDLFWGVVISSFMIANGIILNQKSAEVKALRQETKRLATTVADLRTESFVDYSSLGSIYQRLDQLDKHSDDDFVAIGNLDRQVSRAQNATKTSFEILSGDLGLVENKVGSLERNSLNDFFSIADLKEKTKSLADQQDGQSTNYTDLKKELDACETYVVDTTLSLSDLIQKTIKTLAHNADLTASGLSDTNLTCRELSPGHLGNLYTSDNDGNLSVLGDCNGKFWEKEKAARPHLGLQVSPDVEQQIYDADLTSTHQNSSAR